LSRIHVTGLTATRWRRRPLHLGGRGRRGYLGWPRRKHQRTPRGERSGCRHPAARPRLGGDQGPRLPPDRRRGRPRPPRRRTDVGSARRRFAAASHRNGRPLDSRSASEQRTSQPHRRRSSTWITARSAACGLSEKLACVLEHRFLGFCHLITRIVTLAAITARSACAFGETAREKSADRRRGRGYGRGVTHPLLDRLIVRAVERAATERLGWA
jgi:hypothetical protein